MQRKERLLTEAESTCTFLIDHVKDHMAKKPAQPQAWWKFGAKIAYVRVNMLAQVMEFNTPTTQMQTFVLPLLKTLLAHFCPELSQPEGQVKVLPDHYYSFEYRRVWAKLRRTAFYAVESDQCYRQLIFDEFTYYGDLYQFRDQVQPAQDHKTGVEALAHQLESQLKVKEMSETFEVDFKNVIVKPIDFAQLTAEQVYSQPILQVLKTMHGLSKLFTVRSAFDRCS